MSLHTTVIFLSGAATLSLELLASRVMTPYFGVSLFIWSGILSITLISLALGYYFGGRLTHVKNSCLSMGQEKLFFLLPGLSGISIGLSCLFYPHLFPRLSNFSPVLGAYIASVTLLLPPLIAISAMNPLLISIKKLHHNKSENRSGDTGAGHIFFLSTLGSVLGVLITAFVFIPNITNFFSLLMIGSLLSAVSLLFALGNLSDNRLPVLESLKRLFAVVLLCSFLFAIGGSSMQKGDLILYQRILAALLMLSCWFTVSTMEMKDRHLKLILRVSATGLLLCLGLLCFSSPFLNRDSPLSHGGFSWKIEKEYTSLFGNIKILHGTRHIVMSVPGERTYSNEKRLLFHDGLIQNAVNGEGASLTGFTYALEHLAKVFKADAKSALVLGLGAGVIPARLARQNVAVDVVEVNPAVLDAAKEYFAFDDMAVSVYQTDARTFVKGCPKKYDLLIVDLFQGDGTPDYLLTREFFSDLNQCLKEEGVALFNTFMYVAAEESYYHILKTLHSGFKHIKMFYEEGAAQGDLKNVYLAAMKVKREYVAADVSEYVPDDIRKKLNSIFSSTVMFNEKFMEKASINSDENNFISFTNVEHYVAYRHKVLESLPTIFLVN